MLFKRRDKLSFITKVGNLVWPKMGLRRMWHYYRHRTIRIPASEHSIAAGLAFGALVSWTPTFGTHLIQCAIFNWVTKTSFPAAFIGSIWGNFLTTPALMLISFHAGKLILTTLGLDHLVFQHADGVTEVTESSLEAAKIFIPTLVGGYAMGILTFPIFYYPTYYMVKAARATRRSLIERNIHDKASEMTKPGTNE